MIFLKGIMERNPKRNVKKILVIGATGNIGSSLLEQDNNKTLIGTSRSLGNGPIISLNPYNKEDIKLIIREHNIDSIVLLSATSKVDACYKNINLSSLSNIELPKIVSKASDELNKQIIFMSTEYIYNGEIEKEKNESVKNICPKNYYSLQKYAAETLVLETNKRSLILRLPKVYNFEYPGNFVYNFINKVKDGSKLHKVAADQIFSPLSTYDLYKIIVLSANKDLKGIYNCGGIESKSRYEFILDIINSLKLNCMIEKDSLLNISGDSDLPLNVAMDSSKLHTELSYWPNSLKECIKRIL